MIKLPDEVDDQEAILLSDIFPTGYFAADIANIHAGHTVAVFGCGPVGQFTIASAMHMGAGRVIAIDTIESRLEMARNQEAEIIDFNDVDPVERIRKLTGGIGADRAIDAVGVDAMAPLTGPRAEKEAGRIEKRIQQVRQIAPGAHPHRGNWVPGNAPSEVLEWGVSALAKGGQFAIVGVYPEAARHFPIGQAMMKNLTVRMGNCNHRRYAPKLVEMVRAGVFQPTSMLSQIEPLTNAVEAYRSFDERRPGWLKVELIPAA
ncbi:MAG TPA: zinc-binding dehydrogenase [Bryobacteraceae bacterium]|nr:zinc-binding dehydrogenase [Bryobacteraceae bacterium]